MDITASSKKYRPAIDTHPLWGAQGRARYIEVYKNMGFWDICECEDYRNIPHRKRADSGPVGLTECTKCKHLVWPMSAIYQCDECLEPTLSDTYPVSAKDEFLCSDCE